MSRNPKSRIPAELRLAARRLTMTHLGVLSEILRGKAIYDKDGNMLRPASRDSDKLAALKIALEYGYGKPVQPVGGEEEGGGITVRVLTLTEAEEEDGDPDRG